MASKNKIATGALSAVAVIALVGAWWQAPVRNVSHSVASSPVTSTDALTSVPSAVHSAWQTSVSEAYDQVPIIAGGVVVSSHDDGISGINPATGSTAWNYSRSDRTLCSVGALQGAAVASFATDDGANSVKSSGNTSGNGCSEAVALAGDTGQYKAERSGINALNVARLAPASSNVNFLGTIAPSRLELWRSDLVRTIEMGEVEAPQEPGYQPTAHCTIRSAAVGTASLITLQECPVDAQITQNKAIIGSGDKEFTVAGSATSARQLVVTFGPASPSDARKPEFKGMGVVSSSVETTAQLVAANDSNALVFVQGATPNLVVYTNEGKVSRQFETAQPPALAAGSPSMDSNGVFTPDTTTAEGVTFWWNGESLLAFDSQNFSQRYSVPNALGTGTLVGKQYVVPTTEGWTVIDPASGAVSATVAVDRGSEAVTHVAVRVVGNTLVELQTTASGSHLVGYQGV